MDWHVYPRDRSWGLRKHGSGRCTGSMVRWAEAIAEAVHQAQKTNGVVYVHNSDGIITRRIKGMKCIQST